MIINWSPLDDELRRWADEEMSLPIWLRDDDAVRPTKALERLTGLADRTGVPVHLAVIPAEATEALAGLVAGTSSLIPVVHGWEHRNHAPADEKKAEFGAHRPLAVLKSEAGAGLEVLRDLFGPALSPMFVPPWNRMADDLPPVLASLGYRWLSTFTPRKNVCAAPGLEQVNTHLDPIDWRGGRGLADPDALVLGMSAQLAARRAGHSDAAEPFGILTHHLIHDDAVWTFVEALLDRLLTGPVSRWSAQTAIPGETT